MTNIFKTLQEDIIKLAESQETDFLPLIKSVYGDTPDAVLKGAVFASHIYKEGGKQREKILLECNGELKEKKSDEHIKTFNQMFPEEAKKIAEYEEWLIQEKAEIKRHDMEYDVMMDEMARIEEEENMEDDGYMED